jgi:hypothetical protein
MAALGLSKGRDVRCAAGLGLALRKGQIRRLPKTDIVGQMLFIGRMLGIAI